MNAEYNTYIMLTLRGDLTHASQFPYNEIDALIFQ